MAVPSNPSPPVIPADLARSAFFATAARAFLLWAALFELTAYALLLTSAGSSGQTWWSLLLPHVASLLVAVGLLWVVSKVKTATLAASKGLCVVVGIVVTAAAIVTYLVGLKLLSDMGTALSAEAGFILGVCLFSAPLGAVYGLMLNGAATQSCEAGDSAGKVSQEAQASQAPPWEDAAADKLPPSKPSSGPGSGCAPERPKTPLPAKRPTCVGYRPRPIKACALQGS